VKPTSFNRRRALVAVGFVLLALTVTVPALGVVVQGGELRVSITARQQPYKLPRVGRAPIDIFLAGHIASTTGETPPQLQRMEVRLNRRGVLDTNGLPRCHQGEIAPASDRRALERCGSSLVGSGHFWASIVLPGQRSYHTSGKLLVFNGVRHGHPVLFAHIYTRVPFPSSFVVTFVTRRLRGGAFGTELTASLPQALGDWGFVNRIKMTIGRTYRDRGRTHGFVNAGCPAPKGLNGGVFSLAVADFYFAGGQHLRARIDRTCGVRK
jgi:hypothetical protein